MTIAILNFMKFSVYLFKKSLSHDTNLRDASGYYKRDAAGRYEMDDEGRPLEHPDQRFKIRVFVDDLQATQPQRWRDDPLLKGRISPPEAPEPGPAVAPQPQPATPQNNQASAGMGEPKEGTVTVTG